MSIDPVFTLIRRFCRDESGHFAALGIVGIIPLLLVVVYVVNTASLSHDGVRAQDAADMMALAHANETARGLNTMAMNHVSLTQTYSTAVNSSAMENTIRIHQAVLLGAKFEAVQYGVSECSRYPGSDPVTAVLKAICLAPSASYALELTAQSIALQNIRRKYKPQRSLETASAAIRALNAQNQKIRDRQPLAISTQLTAIGAEHAVEDFYVDQHCQYGKAATCAVKDKTRLAMEVPVVENTTAGYASFCLGLFYGTGGVSSGNSVISSIPFSLGEMGNASLLHGSFERRQFPLGEGPMNGGGDDSKYLPVHISNVSGLGFALYEYDRVSDQNRLFDGFLNLHIVGYSPGSILRAIIKRVFWGRSAGSVANGPRRAFEAADEFIYSLAINARSTENYPGTGIVYPEAQSEDDNIFIDQVNLRVASKCSGSFTSVPLVGKLLSSLGGLVSGAMTTVPDFDVYMPIKPEGRVSQFNPNILPSIEDFHDDFKPLIFVARYGKDRWYGGFFRDPEPAIISYAQAIIYNTKEITMFSQNWTTRLMPAAKLHDPGRVGADMETKARSVFFGFGASLSEHAEFIGERFGQGSSEWADAITR